MKETHLRINNKSSGHNKDQTALKPCANSLSRFYSLLIIPLINNRITTYHRHQLVLITIPTQRTFPNCP